MLTSNFSFLDELESFFDQEIIHSLYNFISNPNSDHEFINNESNHHNNSYCKITFEWEKLLNNNQETEECEKNSFDEISARIIKELIGNLFRHDEANISFKSPNRNYLNLLHSDHRSHEELIKRVDKLIIVLDELIFMIREDRLLLNDLEQILKRKKLVSLWISVANSIVLFLFYLHLVVDFEKCGISQDWISDFDLKMGNSYVQYILYQYVKLIFYKTACASLQLQDVDVDFNRVYDALDSIKLDLTKNNHLLNYTEMKDSEIMLHIFSKYFFCKSTKSGEFLHKYKNDGALFILEIVMNYLISIGDREFQAAYAQKIHECFSRKIKFSMTYCLGLKCNLYLIHHAVTASFISTLKQPNLSDQLFTFYNDMNLLIHRAFTKDKIIRRLSKIETLGSEDLELFQLLLNQSSADNVYMIPVRGKQLFYDKTDELILLNSTQSTERNILESIYFKLFILIPDTSIASFIVTKMIPKLEKIEILIKCCMECYFNETKIENNSPFLSIIFYILTSQLAAHNNTTEAIFKAYRLAFNMKKEGKEGVISYYPQYQTDAHYQNSKDLLESILKDFTTNISQVYPRELRIVLNQVICCLMDRGQKEDEIYISLFNNYFRNSIYNVFEIQRGRLKDQFIYKYINTFSISSPYFVDIFGKFNNPKKMEQMVDELYPKLSLRNLIFVDANQRHRPFIPLSADLATLEELTIVELKKKFKSFIQFSLFPQLAHLTDVIIYYSK